ncbi:unnamed protein product [Urochloa humidicola]
MPPPSYHPYGGFHPGIPYEANFSFPPGGMSGRGVAIEGARSSSPVESMAYSHGFVGSGSASPISPSPISPPAPQSNGEDVSNQEWSDASDGEQKKTGRMNWTEEEDLKLVSAWLNHSVDPVKGNNQKGEHFWKNLVAEFNSNIRPERIRTIPQCKTHYSKTNRLIVHFNGCWVRMHRAHGSGESDDQIMTKAHAIYKEEEKGRPFTLEYWWRAVKDQPKWAKRSENQIVVANKRSKHTESGDYTSSSNQDSEDAEPSERYRLEGQKKAKAKLKGKEKKLTPEMSLESLKAERMKVYHEATMKRAEAMEKAAEATKVRATNDMLNKYLNLMAEDTTGYSEKQKQCHENVLNYMEMQLFPAEK